jgi:hypothetical protein
MIRFAKLHCFRANRNSSNNNNNNNNSKQPVIRIHQIRLFAQSFRIPTATLSKVIKLQKIQTSRQ